MRLTLFAYSGKLNILLPKGLVQCEVKYFLLHLKYYYKQAVAVDKSYNQQIAQVMEDANLSDPDKETQKKQLEDDQKEAIDKIYEQNKNYPQ